MSNLQTLQSAMSDLGIEALLISDLASVGWLTGFSGSAGRAIVTKGASLFVTDSRYTVQAGAEVTNMPTASFSTPKDADVFLAEQAAELGLANIAFEKPSLTYAAYEKLKSKLGSINLAPVDDIVPRLRMRKSPSEVELIKEACIFADRTFEYMLDRVQMGRTEMDLNLDLEFYIRRHGHGLAFDPIVVSGENSAKPHGKATNKVLNQGDFVTMDFGAQISGYNSDLTRTVVVGAADAHHREVYNQVLKAQMAALDAIRPGVKVSEPDRIARAVLDELDLSKYFGHGLGHGLGRVVHDTGRMSAASDEVFEEGQVWTVEPGVYIPDFGGVRIEDDIHVLADGIEMLTHAPKELIEIPRR